ESNAGRPDNYAQLMETLIKTWRTDWQQGDFPFLFVQLANYLKPQTVPKESNWAKLREQQLKTLAVPNTAMAVIIDIGEWNDIHPLNKQDVGKRLALAAQKLAYKEDIVYSGPIFKSARVKGNKVILTFDHIGSGLVAKEGGKQLKQFAIAGENGQFQWAKAKIKKNKVIVSSKSVTTPKMLRYAWADNPDEANLFNREGLPASPFQIKKL
ncbi:MAG: sialate O-acetylesterase, partial [Bacteroidota bacterium]